MLPRPLNRSAPDRPRAAIRNLAEMLSQEGRVWVFTLRTYATVDEVRHRMDVDAVAFDLDKEWPWILWRLEKRVPPGKS